VALHFRAYLAPKCTVGLCHHIVHRVNFISIDIDNHASVDQNCLYWIILWTISGSQWTSGFSIIFWSDGVSRSTDDQGKKMLSPPEDTIFLQHIMMLWLLLAPLKQEHKANMTTMCLLFHLICVHTYVVDLACWQGRCASPTAINISKNNALHRWHAFLLFLCSWPPWSFHWRNPNERWSISLLPWSWHSIMNNWRWRKCTA